MEIEQTQTNIQPTRREFIRRASAVAMAAVSLGGGQLVAADTTKGPEEDPNQANPSKKPNPARFRKIKVDHARAKKEFGELLQLIPEQDRWRSPLKPGAKNIWPVLVKLSKEHQSLSKLLEHEPKDPAERLELEDVLYEAEELPVPWPDENHFKYIQKYLAANEGYYKKLRAAIATHDYYSEFDTEEFSYREDLFDFDIQTLREAVLFLCKKVLVAIRDKEWKHALAEIGCLRDLVRLGHETKGFLIHGLIHGAMVGIVRDMAIRVAKHPDVPLDVLEQVNKILVTTRVDYPKMAHYHRLELQQYFVNQIAQVPLTKNIRDQVPALVLMGYRDLRGDDIQFAEDEEGKLPNASEILDNIVDAALERAIPCLADHPKPFDKAKTIQYAWQHHRTMLAELAKHKSPSLTMKMPEELLTHYRALNEGLGNYLGIERVLLGSNSEPPEPLPEKEIDRLRQVFRGQENPLGQLYYASLTVNEFSNPQYLDLAIQHEYQLAAEVQLACLMFERQEKRRPKTWAEVVDKRLLADEPISPYSGKVLGYDPERGDFWRQGKDGTEVGKRPEPTEDHDFKFEFFPGYYKLIEASDKP